MRPSFELIMSDLSGMTDYVDAVRLAGQDTSRVLASTVSTLTSRLQTIGRQITSAEATQLTIAIGAGPWTIDQTTTLCDAVLASTTTVESSPATKDRRPMQRCDHFENYMTQPEWDSLRSRAPRTGKIAQITSRAWSVGLTCPMESTTYRMACIIGDCDDVRDVGDLVEIHTQVKKTLKLVDASRRYPHVHMTVYPETAESLPRVVYDYAYDEPPVNVVLPTLDVVAALGTVRMASRTSSTQN